MKKYILLLILAFALTLVPFWNGATIKTNAIYANAEIKVDYCENMPENGAESAIVIHSDSKSVLFEKNADKVRGMASTTKIMTALVAIENCDTDKEFIIPKEAVGVEGSSVYLQEGEKLTLGELLYCLLLESGNDSAVAIAICVGGSLDNFVGMMNAKAKELGLKSTHFANPHGLSADGHYTTARELAIITAEAMKYPLFTQIVSTKHIKVRYNNTENGRYLFNHNKLLNGYKGCIGVKTGYTIKDGKCLVSAAEKDNLRVIAVTLRDTSPTYTHIALLNAAFDSFSCVNIAKKGEIKATVKVEKGNCESTTATNPADIWVCLPKGAEYSINLKPTEPIIAPARKNQIIAQAEVVSNGRLVYIINLELAENIEIKRRNLWEKIFG